MNELAVTLKEFGTTGRQACASGYDENAQIQNVFRIRLEEDRVVLDECRLDYNHRRPHSSLAWQTPAAYAATLDDSKAEVFSAASDADPPVTPPSILS